MNNLKEDIKIPTQEEKKALYVDVILNTINSNTISESKQITGKIQGIREKLSEDELNAIYSLALEIKKSISGFRKNYKLLEFLNISEYCKNDNGNLIRFVNAIVNNINQERKFFPNRKWNLSVEKIFDRMEGKDPYAEEMNKRNYINLEK